MKIVRSFRPADRYVYDFGLCSTKNGFAQFDTGQDASYYGTWANPHKLAIVCYCEGDVTATMCDNVAEFVSEMNKLKEWNEESGNGFKGIDPGFNEELKAAFVEMGLGGLLH